MQILDHSLRGLFRELRAGPVLALALAVFVAVAAVTSVGFFTDRVQRAMVLNAAEIIGGDLVVSLPEPLDASFVAEGVRQGFAYTRHVEFRSVVTRGDRFQLVEIKAVDEGWPLRGTPRIATEPFGVERPAGGIPAHGEVWVEARLLPLLDIGMGDEIGVGESRLRITRVLTHEPDRGGGLFQIGPRVLLNLDDLAATGLVVPASRVRHHELFAGPPAAVDRFREWLVPRLPSNARLLDVREARPEMNAVMQQGERFLGLAALTAVLLAGAAVAVAARHYSERASGAVAVMRALGASRRFVLAVFLLRLGWVALVAGLAGVLAGFAAQSVLAQLLEHWFPAGLPGAGWLPVVQGLGVAFVTALGFALPPLLRLGEVPPLRVLRHDLELPRPSGLLVAAVSFAAFGALVLWQARDLRLAAMVLGGAAATAFLLWLLSFVLVRLVVRFRARGGPALRQGIANLSRRDGLAVVQTAAFGVGIMAMLLLTIVRVDLLENWNLSLPADAPNQFLVNIQPEQVDTLAATFAAEGLAGPRLYPMIRGRLVAINGAPVSPDDYEARDPRAARLVAREFNLSHAAEPSPDNRIVAGRWWAPGETNGFSVEEGLAKTLGLKLGDRLRFSVAGQDVESAITSLRTVRWDSFNVNFFVISPPALLSDFPATWITSFHLPAGREGFMARLVGRFPSVTVIDVRALMAQVRAVMERGSRAVEYVFLFTLLAGLTVLYAAVQVTRETRAHEAALMRALGASRGRIARGLLVEFAVLGLLAGLLAAACASVVGWVLAVQVFDLPYAFNPWLWLIGAAGGAAGIGLAGLFGTLPVLRRPPLAVLRGG